MGSPGVVPPGGSGVILGLVLPLWLWWCASLLCGVVLLLVCGCPMYEYDLVVVGGGSGGVRAARLAAERGMRVVLIERNALGGTCVNRGCVPKKLMVLASSFPRQGELAAAMGWSVRPGQRFDWGRFMDNKDTYIRRLNKIYLKRLLQAGVNVVSASGQLRDANTVEASGKVYTASSILLATGGRPVLPDLASDGLGLSSDDMFMLRKRPRRVLVVGGGYIALEFACIMRGFGSKVTLVHRNDTFLRGFDREITAFLLGRMRQQGITIITDCSVQDITADTRGRRVVLSNGSSRRVDAVLFATGRVPAVEGLGLEAVGLDLDGRGRLPVDSDYRSAVPSIYAIGDLAGHKALTPVAIAEAEHFVATLCGDSVPAIDYSLVASAVFTEPSVATVGLSEEAARARGIAVVVHRSDFVPLHEALSSDDKKQRSLVKIVCDPDGKLLGMHIVGHEAGEIIQGFAVAVRAGMNISELRHTIAVHPTMAEEFVTL